MKRGITRREREVTDLQEIIGILDRAKIVHVGMIDEDMPYVVPMNYGYTMEDGKLTKLVLMPVELNFDKSRSMGGWPRPKYDDGILERLAEMSKPYGTKIDIVDGMGIVRL